MRHMGFFGCLCHESRIALPQAHSSQLQRPLARGHLEQNIYKKTGCLDTLDHIRTARLKSFGSILRLDLDAPAQRSMDMYLGDGKRPRGRPAHLLPTRLSKDLEAVKLKFKSSRDLEQLRTLASDRTRWSNLFSIVKTTSQTPANAN